MDILIDIMDIEDLDSVIEIENYSFTNPWSRETFKQELIDNPDSLYLTANTGRQIVGYIGSWLLAERLHITNLAIDRCFRNRGIARELLEKILFFGRLNKVTICTLEVRVSNYKAINLYKKLGFMLYGLNKNYYRDNNEDALIMWKELNHGQER